MCSTVRCSSVLSKLSRHDSRVPLLWSHGPDHVCCSHVLVQVEQQTLGELQAGAQQGSMVLYSSELQAEGLNALCCNQLKILESWGNGTNTEVRWSCNTGWVETCGF